MGGSEDVEIQDSWMDSMIKSVTMQRMIAHILVMIEMSLEFHFMI
jgi:hypothetical protein